MSARDTLERICPSREEVEPTLPEKVHAKSGVLSLRVDPLAGVNGEGAGGVGPQSATQPEHVSVVSHVPSPHGLVVQELPTHPLGQV